jgi:hypothetical protein
MCVLVRDRKRVYVIEELESEKKVCVCNRERVCARV